jgi:hypothetical protein
MFWSFLIVFTGSLAGAASLGELCSLWPTADGQVRRIRLHELSLSLFLLRSARLTILPSCPSLSQIAWAANLAPKFCRRFVRYYAAW